MFGFLTFRGSLQLSITVAPRGATSGHCRYLNSYAPSMCTPQTQKDTHIELKINKKNPDGIINTEHEHIIHIGQIQMANNY